MHAAVFAYGATGSGKTHTMLGPNPKKAATPSSEFAPPRSTEADGLMVRAIVQIFKYVEESENPAGFKVSLQTITRYNVHKNIYLSYVNKNNSVTTQVLYFNFDLLHRFTIQDICCKIQKTE